MSAQPSQLQRVVMAMRLGSKSFTVARTILSRKLNRIMTNVSLEDCWFIILNPPLVSPQDYNCHRQIPAKIYSRISCPTRSRCESLLGALEGTEEGSSSRSCSCAVRVGETGKPIGYAWPLLKGTGLHFNQSRAEGN